MRTQWQNPEGALSREARQALAALAYAAIVVICATAIVYGVYRAGIDPFELLREPQDQFGYPLYGGLISNFGVSVLTMAAAIAGFAAVFGCRRRARLAAAAVLSAVLAADDQYMLHEVVGPRVFGIPEPAFFLVYAATSLAIAWSIGPRLVLPRHALLLVAGGALALSVVMDLVLPITAYTLLAEDMAKLGGLVLWLFYWSFAAARAMPAASAPERAEAAGRAGGPELGADRQRSARRDAPRPSQEPRAEPSRTRL